MHVAHTCSTVQCTVYRAYVVQKGGGVFPRPLKTVVTRGWILSLFVEKPSSLPKLRFRRPPTAYK